MPFGARVIRRIVVLLRASRTACAAPFIWAHFDLEHLHACAPTSQRARIPAKDGWLLRKAIMGRASCVRCLNFLWLTTNTCVRCDADAVGDAHGDCHFHGPDHGHDHDGG